MVSTPVRHVRIPDAEWHALQAAAEAEGLTAAIVIRQAVRRYLAARPVSVHAPDVAQFPVACALCGERWPCTQSKVYEFSSQSDKDAADARVIVAQVADAWQRTQGTVQ